MKLLVSHKCGVCGYDGESVFDLRTDDVCYCSNCNRPVLPHEIKEEKEIKSPAPKPSTN